LIPQLHGALEIGEQDRHLLAFAFEGRARGEVFVGEVRRGIAHRFLGWQEDRGSRGCLGLAGQWRATLPAEFEPRRIRNLPAGESAL
jgi:hypothetical protein